VNEEATCSIEDCERPVKSRGWCSVHYSRWYKMGDPLWVPARQRGVITDGYSHVHMQLRKTRGLAKDRLCAECEKPAGQWSFCHRDVPPDEILTSARGRPFHPDPIYYVPRCGACHYIYDERGLG
jgi:hypothetical protein